MKKKELEKRKNSMRAELPELLNTLVLLLSAGLVLTQAVEKIAEDGGDSYLMCSLREITAKMRGSNADFTDEFRSFARDTGVRELIRLANIFRDNVDMGAELVSKLEQESAFMWHMSLKQVEEQGRLAESKLTFPLSLMLVALLMITCAPAFMLM